MVRDYFKRWALEQQLAKVENRHEKFKQTPKYKKLSAEDKHNEDGAFYQCDYQPLWEEIEVLKTKELLRKADRLTIPFPRHWEDKEEKYWDTGSYGMTHHLKTAGKHVLIKAIREEQKARRETMIWWIPLISVLTGLSGVALGIISVIYNGTRH